MSNDNPRKARVQDIVTLAARMSDFSAEDILGNRKHKHLVRVRQAIYYVARQQGHSFPLIGARLNRDHSSVMHGIGVANEWLKRLPAFAQFVKDLGDAAAQADPFIPLPASATANIADIVVPAPAPRRDLWRQKKRQGEVAMRLKPKNDFTTKTDADSSHAFHDAVAAGSNLLAEALKQARAA